MVLKTFCDKCGIQLQEGGESNEISVNVGGVGYYSGHLCQSDWKDLMKTLDKYFRDSGDKAQ